MSEKAERGHTLQEKLASLGINAHATPPLSKTDAYGGFFEITGKGTVIADFLKTLAQASGRYERYRLHNLSGELGRFNRRGPSTVDLEFKNLQDETRLIRAQTYGTDSEGNLAITFGGGGNMTTLEEMEYVLTKTADAALSSN